MFLHIGNNVLIRKDDVIGIFNISAMSQDSKGKKFCAETIQKKETIDISDGKQTSIILTPDATYVSRISTATLLARSGEPVERMLSAEGFPASAPEQG